MIEILKELKDRWNSESPKFWKKLMTISISIGTSAVAVIGADKLFDLQSYGVPQMIFQIAGYVIVACATLGLSAQITKKDGDTN